MKVKCRPEDFQVEELTTISPTDQGAFVLYKLKKSGLGTPEALDSIRRRWNLPASSVHHGGLKDRHAITIQYITIRNGPMRWLTQSNLQLEPLGRVDQPYGPACFRGNRFAIVMRDLDEPALELAHTALQNLESDRLPNYFDDQRFGSVTADGQFIAEAWMRGRLESALWLALAAPNLLDRPQTRDAKQTLRALWGDWPAAKAQLDRSNERSIVTYLVDHPDDHKGAFTRLRRDMRSLYFSAFQSHLWNLMLGEWIRQSTRAEQRAETDFKTAHLPIHRHLDPTQAQLFASQRIPLPTSRNPEPTGVLGEIARRVLEPFELAWNDLRVRHIKDVFLSKGDRAVTFPIQGLQTETAPDDLYPGRQRIALSFELPKGSYATLVVKRLTAQ
jgi:tRNA pseudouridine13 synthase